MYNWTKTQENSGKKYYLQTNFMQVSKYDFSLTQFGHE